MLFLQRMEERYVSMIQIPCMECGACVLNCSFKALSVDKGVGCAEAVFNSMINGGEPSCDCGPSCSGDGGKSSCC